MKTGEKEGKKALSEIMFTLCGLWSEAWPSTTDSYNYSCTQCCKGMSEDVDVPQR